jgi:hypothetical protein
MFSYWLRYVVVIIIMTNVVCRDFDFFRMLNVSFEIILL